MTWYKAGTCAVFSLPTQRCFLLVFLLQRAPITFLCLRRGVSKEEKMSFFDMVFSLPTQRCFHKRKRKPAGVVLFSAYAEVFLTICRRCLAAVPFLCLRRGVSYIDTEHFRRVFFSLPTQRCFPDIKQLFLQPILFSAYAEMFPSTQSEQSDVWAFLCLHRGVS